MMAQNLTLRGVYQQGRNNDGELESTYVGYNSTIGKAIFVVPQGLYKMEWDGATLTKPEKDPAVNISDFYANGQFTDNDKALWATNFNLMYANSGAVIADGVITTVMSRAGDEIDDSERFVVRKWDAQTGDLLSTKYYPRSACLESAGMAVNPKDGKVYGFFYLTEQQLPDDITSDPDFFVDTEGDATDTDAGYCLCTIDLETMAITPITPGLYYGNFVTFAINSQGRAFTLTSGGSSIVPDENDRVYDIDGNLAGATLCEIDLATGLIQTVPVQAIDPETGEEYTEYVNKYNGTGYCSQYKRQSACFSKTNPNKMYWNGYVNSGKGINSYGSWGPLPDSEWRTNGKYDTALYEVDLTTGEATRLAKITDRYSFACLWVDGDVEVVVPGDINGDGVVDIADVNAVINAMLGNGDATGADMDGSGIVDIADVNAVINLMLGK